MTRRRSLTPAQCAEIRAIYRPGVRGFGYEALAKRFGVGASTVRDLLTFRVRF